MNAVRALLCAVLAAGAASCASARGGPEAPGGDVVTLLQTGHRGEVLALEYDEGRGLLFSGGEDGALRVWDPANRSLVARIGIGRLPLAAIAVNPAATQVAVLESDGVRSFAVSAWDWIAERRLFRVTLAGEPLFLRYSGGGRWLMLGESAWQGLRMLAAADGSPFAFRPEGFGIVGFAEVSRSERTVLTYQPSGRLQYWEATSGNLTTELRAAPYLSGLRISRDRRYAAGTNGSEVLLIDLVTGATRARLPLAGVRSLDLSPAADEIACLAPSGTGRLELSRWTLSGDRFVRTADPPVDGVTAVRYAAGALVYGSGGALRVAAAETIDLARDELAAVTGIAADGALLAAASPSWVWIFELPYEEASRGGSRGSVPSRALVAPNPLGGPTGLSFVGGRLVAWRQGDGTPAAVTIDTTTGEPTGTVSGLFAPLLQLEPASGRLVGLDRTGTVRLVDLPEAGSTAGPLFDAWLPGTLCVVAAADGELVAGRIPVGGAAGGGTMLRVNTRTGETVAVPSGGRSTFDLAWDGERGILYSLGIDAAGDTALMSHSGPGFESGRVLVRCDGEDLAASLALDHARGAVYTSLATGGIAIWDGSAAEVVPTEGRVPRRLAVVAGLVASVNGDATVSFWDPVRRELSGDLYLLASGDWCLVGADGRWSSTEGAAPLVRVTVDGALAADPSPWRKAP